MLLFFDGVTVLVPDYMRGRPLFTDPTLAQPLSDHGLLHRLSPEALVDQQTVEAPTELLDDLLRADASDGLDPDIAFAEISYSRLGGSADAGLTEVVIEQLRERGLARSTVDGVSIPLHPAVRAFVLVVLPQLLRTPAEAAGDALQPTSTPPDRPSPHGHAQPGDDAQQWARRRRRPRTGHSRPRARAPRRGPGLPRQHGDQHRAYARDLRQFVRDAAALGPADLQQAFPDRRKAQADAADELRRLAWTSWRRPLATFGLGIAKSTVVLAYGTPIGAGLTAAGALLGLRRQTDPTSAYTYLFQAQ